MRRILLDLPLFSCNRKSLWVGLLRKSLAKTGSSAGKREEAHQDLQNFAHPAQLFLYIRLS